ncbi:MAG: phage tail protein, partial [Gammaproteobacteria bacterium]|nr:phage tail protein [Gammaproteobacteria bacterium]
LFGKDVETSSEGPRLESLQVQTSTYGRDIPIVYGGARIAGNVIWSAGIQEKKHTTTTTQGGKGGPEVSSTETTYTYSASFAIGLCEGEIAAISRIWADGKLLYDFSSNATAEAIFSSTQLADDLDIYLGTETQAANSLIEAAEGTGNVPGFRGMAYIVFDTFQLEKFGNRIPNISVEVVENATINYKGPLVNGYPGVGENFTTVSDDGLIRYWEGARTVNESEYDHLGTIYNLDGDKVGDDLVTIDAVASATRAGSWGPVRNVNMRFGLYRISSTIYTVAVNADGSFSNVYLLDGRRLTNTTGGGYNYQITSSVYYNGAVYAMMGAPELEKNIILKFDATTTLISGQVVTEYTATDSVKNIFANKDGVYFVQGDTGTVEIVRLDHDLTYIEEWIVPAVNWPGLYVSGDFAILLSNGGVTYYILTLNDNGTSTTVETGTLNTSTAIDFRPINVGTMLFGGYRYLTTGLVTNVPVALSTIVSDICLKTGLVAGDIDASALTDTVDGYVSNKETTARGLIEPLQQVYLFDVVETDNKLVFVNRSEGDSITVDENDLGASEDGKHKDKINRTRISEMELPRKLSVVHLDPSTDYQENIETAARLITDSVNVKTISAPLVISATKAAQIANILLGRVWIERNQYRGFLPFQYVRANPSDILTASIDGVTHTILLTEVSYQIPGIIQFSGVAEDTAQYTSTATGASGGFPPQTAGIAGPTNIELLDIPLLRDQDNTTGFYVGANGYLSGWSAAVLYKSIDGGDSWGSLLTLTSATIMGATTDALADSITTIIDNSSTVNVRLSNGTLSSSTEANILNGVNACLIGNEILNFITATLEADGTYTLSGLLRGRKGTEWAAPAHAAGDRFVFLDEATMSTIIQDSSEIGVARDYKGVTTGGNLQTTSSESFTNNAVRLKPLSPVHMAGSRDGSDNLTITWIRRTRISGAWRDYVDVPFGEESASYEVDIVSGSPEVVARTIPVTSATASYTAAEQTTDGFTPGDPVNVNIYQLSATVGRGYVGKATI